jgi:hypothetical protein
MPVYLATHRHIRKAYLARYIPGITLCWRCELPIRELDTSKIHLGHDDHNPLIYKGLEHAHCNTSAGATQGNLSRTTPPARGRTRRRTQRRSRIW